MPLPDGVQGVPDDAVYDHFEYSKFFRKNVQLIASVIPDPGTDRQRHCQSCVQAMTPRGFKQFCFLT